MNTLKSLVKDLFSTEMLLYIFFGVGTAAIDYITEIFLYNVLPFHNHGAVVITANSVSFILSVTFAFVTNKRFVFKSKSESRRDLRKEGFRFFLTRFFSFSLSLIGMVILVDCLEYDNAISKIAVSVFVVILNYLFSKLLIFPSNNGNDAEYL